MEIRKEIFFGSIDFDNHLNTETKEAYWRFYENDCGKNIQKLYEDGRLLFPEAEGLHQYVQFSLRESKQLKAGAEAGSAASAEPPASGEKGAPKILPIDERISHEPTKSWGSNDDVKGK